MTSTLRTRALVPGELAIDTDTRLTRARAESLWAAGVRACGRYVGLRVPDSDLSAEELELLIGFGFAVWAIQHTRAQAYNDLDASTGHADALVAIENALAAGYDPSRVPLGDGLYAPSLELDLEGVRSGSDAFGHAASWIERVSAGGFRPVVYLGYDCGLTSSQCDALPCDPVFHCDAGPYLLRPAPEKRFALKQRTEQNLGGVLVDGDEVLQPNAIYGLAAVVA